jgi:O-antigen/teichoic acid export membrane protein
MSDLRNLLRESSHYLGGQIGAMAIGFISFPILTRVLSVADYGMLSLTLQIAAMAVVISKLGLQNSIQRFYQEYTVAPGASSRRSFYSTLLLGAVLSSAVVALLFLVALLTLPSSWIPSTFRRVLLFGFALVFIRAVHPIVMNFLRAERKTKAYNIVDILTKATSIGFVCVLLFAWSRSAKAALVGTVAIESVALLVLIRWVLPRGVISPRAFDGRLYWAAITFGLPMVGYEFAGVILDSGDRILVNHYLGFQAVGYYSAGYNMATYVLNLLMYPINLAIFPIYMKLWVNKGPDETRMFLSNAFDHYVMAALCVMASVAVTARDAVIVLGSRKLQEAYPLLPVLFFGLLVYSLHIFFNPGLIIHKKTATMAKIITGAALLNVLLNVLLIPRIGLQGAAIATLLSYGIFLALIVRESSSVLPLRVDLVECLRYLLAAAATVVLVSRFQYSSEWLDLILKGSMSIFVYAALLWLIDSRTRMRLASFLRCRTHAPTNAAGQADPVWDVLAKR